MRAGLRYGCGEDRVHVETAAAAEGVDDDNRVASILGGGLGILEAAGFGGCAVFGLGAESVARGMNRCQRVEKGAHGG